MQSRSSLRSEEGTEETPSSVGEKKMKYFRIITPVVEALVKFEDDYDYSKGGSLLKDCSKKDCSYLFDDWYEH